MSAVTFAARGRITRRAGVLVAAGVVLGLGFGAGLASFAAARQTASAYDRILKASDASDAMIGLNPGQPIEKSEASLRTIDGITEARVLAGFIGTVAGVDPSYTRAMLASTSDTFALDMPKLTAGRMPNPRAADEILVSTTAANGGGLDVGEHVDITFLNGTFDGTTKFTGRIVGIGTFPGEIVTDETTRLGVMAFTPAFYEQHRDLTVYASASVYLAPGFQPRRTR